MAATGNNIAKSNDNIIQKINLYKDSVIKSMDKVTDFDKSVINANGEYIKNLAQADKEEYEVLKENMKKADSPEERAAIRDRMKEMKKERYAKDAENKEFYDNQQKKHKDYMKQVLFSVAITAGVIYIYRKPIFNAGKALMAKA